MPADEVRESNTPWIKSSDKKPLLWSSDEIHYKLDKRMVSGCFYKDKSGEYFFQYYDSLIRDYQTLAIDDFARIEWLDEEKLSRILAELEALKAENERLKQWKKEAMPMMEDFQAIGKALGIPLGQSIHDKILPGIEAKDKMIAELEEGRQKAAKLLAELYNSGILTDSQESKAIELIKQLDL